MKCHVTGFDISEENYSFNPFSVQTEILLPRKVSAHQLKRQNSLFALGLHIQMYANTSTALTTRDFQMDFLRLWLHRARSSCLFSAGVWYVDW